MVHNGIEYGMMAAYGEGLNVLANANIGSEDHAQDAETAPLDAAEYYQYDIDLAKVTEVWRRGSVVTVLAARPHRRGILHATRNSTGTAATSAIPARAAGPSMPPSTRASRCRSCQRRCSKDSRREAATAWPNKVLSAMRAGFGGHKEQQDSSR